jgi:heat shock protein HslJ
MNREVCWIVIFPSLILLASSSLAQTGSGQIADGIWTLTQLSDARGTLRFGGLDAPTLRLLGTGISTVEGTQVSGYGGCNTFKTTAVFTAKTLTLRPIASTLKTCEPSRMQAEARYLNVLKDARSFVRRGQTLIISTPQARGVFVYGTEAGRRLQTQWRLVGAQGNVPLTLRFADGGRVSGSGGCNTFTGRYTLDDALMTIGSLANTRRACPDSAAQTQEQLFLRDLQRVASFQVSGSMLVLTLQDGGTLHFARPVN